MSSFFSVGNRFPDFRGCIDTAEAGREVDTGSNLHVRRAALQRLETACLPPPGVNCGSVSLLTLGNIPPWVGSPPHIVVPSISPVNGSPVRFSPDGNAVLQHFSSLGGIRPTSVVSHPGFDSSHHFPPLGFSPTTPPGFDSPQHFPPLGGASSTSVAFPLGDISVSQARDFLLSFFQLFNPVSERVLNEYELLEDAMSQEEKAVFREFYDYLQKGNFHEVISKYRAIHRQEVNLLIHVIVIMSYLGLGLGLGSDAKQIVNYLLEQSQKRNDIFQNLLRRVASVVYVHTRNLDEALKLIEEVRNLSPGVKEVEVIYLFVKFLQGENVLSRLDKLIASNNDCNSFRNEALSIKAFILYQQDRYDEAIRICDNVLRSDINQCWYCHSVKIRCLLKKHNPDKSLALQACDKALISYPESAEFFFLKGNMLFAGGRNFEAYVAYRSAVQYDPDNMDAVFCLTNVQQRLRGLAEDEVPFVWLHSGKELGLPIII